MWQAVHQMLRPEAVPHTFFVIVFLSSSLAAEAVLTIMAILVLRVSDGLAVVQLVVIAAMDEAD